MTIAPEVLERLRTLHREAPHDWQTHFCRDPQERYSSIEPGECCGITHASAAPRDQIDTYPGRGRAFVVSSDAYDECSHPMDRKSAELACLLRNNLDAILAALDEVEFRNTPQGRYS